MPTPRCKTISILLRSLVSEGYAFVPGSLNGQVQPQTIFEDYEGQTYSLAMHSTRFTASVNLSGSVHDVAIG